MGLARVLTGAFFIVAAFVYVSAAVVNTIPSVFQIYDNHMRERMKSCEFVVNWIGSTYSVLPVLAFIAIKDWTKVFYDCFHPLSLWLDAGYSVVVVILLIIFVGDHNDNFGKIMVESRNVALQLACVLGYVMLRRTSTRRFNLLEARFQNICSLGFLQFFVLAILIQLKFKYKVPDGFTELASSLAYFGMALPVCQLASSICFLWTKPSNTQDNDLSAEHIKFFGMVLKLSTLSYDCWLYISEGYWDSESKKPLVRMTVVSLLVTWCLAFTRFIGIEKIKAAVGALEAYIGRTQLTWKAFIWGPARTPNQGTSGSGGDV